MKRYPPRADTRDTVDIISHLRAMRTIRHTLADRLAFLTGPSAPSAAMQRRMLRIMASDVCALGAQLDMLADALSTSASAAHAPAPYLLRAPAMHDTGPALHARQHAHRLTCTPRTRAGDGGAA